MSYRITEFNERNLNKLRSFVAVDVETTGLSPIQNEIIEISGLKYVEGVLVEEFVSFVKPKTEITPEITKITGITNDMIKEAPGIDETIIAFIGFTEGLSLVAHNADFDMGFINKACQNLGFEPENGVVDTLQISRDLYDLNKYNLVAVASHLGIETDGAHRAKADAQMCAKVFLSSIKKMKTSNSGEDKYASVTQLNRYIKGILERDLRLGGIFLRAEISNFKRHFSGHCYMTLKDDKSSVRAIMFKSSAMLLKFEPENGMKVLLEGRVSVYERDGQYQVYIEKMQPDGVGALHLAFEQLKEKLKEQGLFEDKLKKPIPKFPEKVGVVTSPTGAAVRDIINVITRRFPPCEILLHPAQVQGDGGAQQVAEAIRYFNNSEDKVDVLIVGRGGGSIEDLWVFNEEEVAIAISKSDIPVISAVGHEIDFTIADFVADLRAPTPSAAAELAVPSADELLTRISKMRSQILTSMESAIKHRKDILKRFSIRSPISLINQFNLQVDTFSKGLENSSKVFIDRKRAALAILTGRLGSLSPTAVMERGYSITTTIDGNVINSIDAVKEGDKIMTLLRDGVIISESESKEDKKDGK